MTKQETARELKEILLFIHGAIFFIHSDLTFFFAFNAFNSVITNITPIIALIIHFAVVPSKSVAHD